LNAQGLYESGDVNLHRFLALEGETCGGMFLHSCHRCGPVVANDNDGITAVVGHIQHWCDPGMKKGRVPDHTHHLSLPSLSEGFAHPVCHADAGTHTDAGVKTFQGLHERKCVTADVSVHENLQLAEYVKKPAVWAAGTEIRGSRRDRDVRKCLQGLSAGDGLFDDPWIEFTGIGKDLLPGHLDPHRSDLLFQKRVQLFDHIYFTDLSCKLSDQFDGQRIHHAEFQIRVIGEYLLGIMIG